MSAYPYVCRYLQSPGRPAQQIYPADCLEDAMAAHREAMPGHRHAVLDWEGPLGWMRLTSIPPQPMTVYTLPTDPDGPTHIDTRTDIESPPVPPGHILERRDFAALDGTALTVTWHTVNGAITTICETEDLYGLHHWDTIGHDPFTCDDCPALKSWA